MSPGIWLIPMKNMIHSPDTLASASSGLPVAVGTSVAIQAPSPANSVVDMTFPPKMAQNVRRKLTSFGRYLE